MSCMVNGEIHTNWNGEDRTDYLFRISLKALIYNDEGQILVVKEHGLNWGLPGGGMDHGETFESALARELYEEVGYQGKFTFDVIDTADPMHLTKANIWQVWVVCHVVPETFDFSVGLDAEDMKFIDPSELESSEDTQAVYAMKYHSRHQARKR